MVGSIGFGSASAAASASGLWKSVTADKSSSASSIFQPKQAAEDEVSISKLGQALSGAAADMFSLDSKTKQKLEDIVNNGVMSADDVALGLRGAASSALFYRYSANRPRDDVDRELAARHERAGEYMKNFGDVMADAGLRELRETQVKAFALMEKGKLDTEGFQDMVRGPQQQFQANMEKIRESDDYKNMESMSEHIGIMFKRRGEQFNEEVAAQMADQGVIAFGQGAESLAAVEAKNKLFETLSAMSGGDKSQASALGDVAESYAKAVDLPFIGHEGLGLEDLKRSVALEQGATADAPRSPSAPQANATQAAATSQAYSQAGSTPTATAQTNSAVSLLQGALGAQSKQATTAGIFQGKGDDPSDAALGSLLQALKNGSAQPGSLKLDA